MTAENFCYFLQGYLETSNPEFISAAQTQIIKDHLALVFNKVTPDRSQSETKTQPYCFKVPFDLEKQLSTQFTQTNPSKTLIC